MHESSSDVFQKIAFVLCLSVTEKSFSDHRRKYMLFTPNRGNCRAGLCHYQQGILPEACHQLLEGFLDLKSLQFGLTALKGHYMTQALNDWFIYLQCYSRQAAFAGCYLETTRVSILSANVSV